MPKNKVYLFANWKMYLDYKESNQLAQNLVDQSKNFADNIVMTIFPSALSFYSVAQLLDGVKISLGAQNVYWLNKGGYTGEVSAAMYKDIGCQYALVGHSERRHQFGESNEDVTKKMESCLTTGLIPVLCVGETQAERNDKQQEQVIGQQIKSALTGLDWSKDKQLIIAYEPVWAIGSGNVCSLFAAEKIHQYIREVSKKIVSFEPVILYGGSVKSNNVKEFISSSQVDGVLVGGSSAKLESWLDIAKQVNRE